MLRDDGSRPPASAIVEARSRHFWKRMLIHGMASTLLLAASLASGMAGFMYYEHLPWRDAFLNASMLLSGMGPVDTTLSEPGKVFAGVYALYSGLVVIAVAGLLLSPGVHRVMHRVHWDDQP